MRIAYPCPTSASARLLDGASAEVARLELDAVSIVAVPGVAPQQLATDWSLEIDRASGVLRVGVDNLEIEDGIMLVPALSC